MNQEDLVAKRFAGKPLRQPEYKMRDVPTCSRDLTDSILQEVSFREGFQDAMAEMILLCKEVMRRRQAKDDESNLKCRKRTKDANKNRTTKPLSLEYMADRLDVDDPISGFLVRTTRKEGNMLQGFITVTTFTNWQKSFRWDSMHDSAFAYDSTDLAREMSKGKRKYDIDGKLAAEIQNTVRCGDPWNEGIVWPRVAEVSLLGALGCGKTLLSLVIERLECSQASIAKNYDYIVLQATNNSIPFYESMGFVRVGALTKNPDFENKDTTNDATLRVTGTIESKDGATTQEAKSQIVSSPVFVYTIEKSGQTPAFVAKKFKVDVWDLMFLNQHLSESLQSRSWLRKGLQMYIPNNSCDDSISNAEHNMKNNSKSSATQWYLAKNNETPKEIAHKFGVQCKDLIKANKDRISFLQSNSKLIEATKLQVSNLSTHHDTYVPYCHWTFPDDKFEDNEPSYMMVRKLNRRNKMTVKLRPVESSLAVKATHKLIYSINAPSNVEASITKQSTKSAILSEDNLNRQKKQIMCPVQPLPPKRPLSSYFYFLNEVKERAKLNQVKVKMTELNKSAAQKWSNMTPFEKNKYENLRERDLEVYTEKMNKYKKDYPGYMETSKHTACVKHDEYIKSGFFNKVVKLNEDGLRQNGNEFKYYYVLTYVPDLFWCHLAPMRRKNSSGRPIWKLVNEEEGKELDISAQMCEVVESKVLKGCPDADEEEWDIPESYLEKSNVRSNINHMKNVKNLHDNSHENHAKTPKHKHTLCSNINLHPDQPLPPKRPICAFFIFLNEQKEKMKVSESKVDMTEITKDASQKWRDMSSLEKTKYEDIQAEGVRIYNENMREYKIKMQHFMESHPAFSAQTGNCENIIDKIGENRNTTFESNLGKEGSNYDGMVKLTSINCVQNDNVRGSKGILHKVVKLKENKVKGNDNAIEYYYITTYSQANSLCHLIPMQRYGNLGWILATDHRNELSVTADKCEMVESVKLKRCKEISLDVWDILENEFIKPVSPLPRIEKDNYCDMHSYIYEQAKTRQPLNIEHIPSTLENYRSNKKMKSNQNERKRSHTLLSFNFTKSKSRPNIRVKKSGGMNSFPTSFRGKS